MNFNILNSSFCGLTLIFDILNKTLPVRYLVVLIISSFSLFSQPPGSGNTLDFNGTNQFVSLNSSFGTLSFPMTLTTWFKPGTSQSGPIRFFSSHDMTGAYRGLLFQYINGTINVQCGNGTSRSPTGRWGFVANYTFTTDRWCHIAVVISSATTGQFYVNGNPLSTTLGNGGGVQNLVTDNSNGRLGANTAGNNITFLSGQMDEFTFWDRALTQAEIRDMMCHKLTGSEPNLQAYYRFDNGTGASLSNLVTGGPSGTLMNGLSWVASSAPVGDRSFHNGHSNGASSTGLSLSGDNITINPANTGIAGSHLYIVDSPPSNTAGITTWPSVNYYFGVFNSDYIKTYDVDVTLGATTGTAPTGRLKIAKRPHNASPTWTLTAAGNTPNISLPAQTPISQFIIAQEPCPVVDWMPDDSTACDSMFVDIGGGYSNISWSNGATTNSNAFFVSGQVWVSAVDTASGCTLTDTMDVTIVSPSNIPSSSLDTIICGVSSFTYDISMSGATSYQWFDGNTQPVRIFTNDGSYWFERTFPGGCSTRDTLTLKFAIIATDPVAENELYLCGQDTADVQLRSNTYPEVLWSNGETSWQTEYWQTGMEWVQTKNADGCWQTDSFEILQSLPLSDQAIFADTSFCAGQTLLLSAPSGYTATWPNGQTGDYLVGGTKDIRVELSDGCTESVEYFSVTKYSCECDVQFANAFTPDGDGLNDYFGPVTNCEFTTYNLIILNRWGQQMFESRDENLRFDGRWKNRKLPIGVYVYRFVYSTPYKSGTAQGYFTLMR